MKCAIPDCKRLPAHQGTPYCEQCARVLDLLDDSLTYTFKYKGYRASRRRAAQLTKALAPK